LNFDLRPHDAHVHLERAPDGTTNAARLVVAMDAVGVEMAAAVVPQSMGSDNSAVLEALNEHPGRIVAILKLDVHAPTVVKTATELLDRGSRGLRLTIFDDREVPWLTDGTVSPLFSLLARRAGSVAFHCRPDQLAAVGRVAGQHPELTIFVDHLGRPDVTSGPRADPFEAFLDLARHSNVLAKTPDSAFFSAAPPPHLDLVPFVERALESFGAERVLWGSDWPVCPDYETSMQPALTLLASLSEAERRAVLRDNFERVFCG
jgi:predicted TIM-barrel fold metal-dependent hydrolase